MIPLDFHKFNYFWINPDVVNGKFILSGQLVDKLVNEGKDLMIFDKVTGDIMDLVPFDYVLEHDELDNPVYEFNFVKSELHTIPDWTSKLLRRFHWTWYDAMKDFLESIKFQQMNQKLNNDVRKRQQHHPEKQDIYNAFSTSLNEINVVILGQAPYANEKHANGWAFASKSETLVPESLQQFEKVLGKLPNNLNNWIQQGILLLNSSLTVGPNSNINYYEEWKPLMNEVMRVLSQRDHIVWLLMGSYAQSYAPLISKFHPVVKVEHPAAASWGEREWKHENCFEQVNKRLVDLKKVQINWI